MLNPTLKKIIVFISQLTAAFCLLVVFIIGSFYIYFTYDIFRDCKVLKTDFIENSSKTIRADVIKKNCGKGAAGIYKYEVWVSSVYTSHFYKNLIYTEENELNDVSDVYFEDDHKLVIRDMFVNTYQLGYVLNVENYQRISVD